MNTPAMNPRVGHDGKIWPETFDGMCWAEAFHARFPSVPVDDAIGWFANAIMRGWDEKTWRDAAATASEAPTDRLTKLIESMPQLSTRFDLDDPAAQWIDRVELLRLVRALATTRPPLDLMGVDASRHETERSGKFPDAAVEE